ncbi:winged helix-turn-helix transcriptional regulator [Nocardia cyriacigeorgica]|uniref:metalloregulator ArsR/SmtB family transcription factor n=1 Tax=Nocardia cyriacigeorgica TaxID=135487 RepID=UPI00189391E8|nr:metalloregulator ArsR/SmtB family transcription factor [Nocardia cyriacigeorgica]MBF6087897.1 winged helix-turn-helix transcriptional regulator [Nocardia cyriacigeorgica]MBF6094183.1 winged helix-turn-helix transcriptional regulator [Nocardia cyriacigeorgica]MBF6396178.1 winged helix-turn-helix transcriptional regulator [Nocardia cyriacigeorgica]MBF6401810.1 winged helix-turn-helix transcriptional regulator [Nocardia cyriacigeorgica]
MDEVASAIADPVRREILELLRGTRLTAGEIAGHFSISRPAISRHLRVLRGSGLVHDELVGRQRYYRLDTAPFEPLTRWLTGFTEAVSWERHLDALDTEVYRTRRERRTADEATTADHTTTQENTA